MKGPKHLTLRTQLLLGKSIDSFQRKLPSPLRDKLN